MANGSPKQLFNAKSWAWLRAPTPPHSRTTSGRSRRDTAPQTYVWCWNDQPELFSVQTVLLGLFPSKQQAHFHLHRGTFVKGSPPSNFVCMHTKQEKAGFALDSFCLVLTRHSLGSEKTSLTRFFSTGRMDPITLPQGKKQRGFQWFLQNKWLMRANNFPVLGTQGYWLNLGRLHGLSSHTVPLAPWEFQFH